MYLMLVVLVNSWFKDILTNFSGALAGFGFALLIYYLQSRKDKRKDDLIRAEDQRKVRENQFNEHVRRLDYFGHLLNIVLDDFREEQDRIKLFILEQKKNLLNVSVLKYTPSNNFYRIKSVDARGIFESYPLAFANDEGDWMKRYSELNKNLDYIEEATHEIRRINSSNLETCYKIQLKIKDNVQLLSDQLNVWCVHFVRELGEARHQDPAFQLLDKYLKIYHGLAGGGDIKTFHDEFVEPLLIELNSEYLLTHFAQELMQICKNVRMSMGDLKYEVEHVLAEFALIINHIEKPITVIESNTEKINEFVSLNRPIELPLKMTR